MFSSLLPNVSSGMKFGQNGPAKPTNRFSVRVFKTSTSVPFAYPLNPKMDNNYRAPQTLPPPPPTQPQQQNASWYPSRYVSFIWKRYTTVKNMKPTYAPPHSSYNAYDQRPRTTPNYAIYPSATNDTFIYEQSMCSKSDIFSTSELDNASTTTFSPSSAFSPALSTDSTVTLQGNPMEDQRIVRPQTPAVRGGYPQTLSAPQSTAMSRTASSSNRAHEAALTAESVEEHRRLASLAGRSTTPFRAPAPPTTGMSRVPSTGRGFIEIPEYEPSTFSEMEVEERDRIAKINAGINSASTGSFYTSSTASSSDGRSVPSNVNRVVSSQPLHPSLHFPSKSDPPTLLHSSVRLDSPPSVERIPSELPPELLGPLSQSYPAAISPSRSRDAGYRPEPSRRTSPSSSDPGPSRPQDYTQDRARRPSVVGPRPDIVGQRPTSEYREYGSSYTTVDYRPPTGPSSRPSSDSSGSGSREHARRDNFLAPNSASVPRDSSDHRPIPPSRRSSQAYPDDSPRSPKDGRPYDSRDGVYKVGPLSTSPTQMRASPIELEAAQRQAAAQNSAVLPHDRVRTRSNSFSAPMRQNLPLQISPSDSRRGPEYGSKNPYYPQPGPLPPTSAYDSRPAQPQPSSLPPSRAMDRVTSQNVGSSHARVLTQEPPSSRSQPPYAADPNYLQAPDPSRFATNGLVPRGPIPPQATVKYIDAAGNVRTTVMPGQASSEPQQQRRYSDGDQNIPLRPQLSGRNSAPALRSVRWNENLICPSPLFANQRRKGWFNRRGDQLWTNDGAYKAAAPGQEYPPDLDDYPEHGEGWMNEEGTRIDLGHRLIPKPPLRSALKQPKA
ncbi:hypothetical protein JR316_0009561 [Psilocybe cubensis]|uniref:Uncharacterized protein n=2 Tax=Psilocybe cubensis TaxID=181762 RepID=A0ACB8GNN8_PSICU|nr:hypothetical protein JR316_0009561 [Psilocybe cubensis]KAH9477355.1 hypothetical protein JR316_0009561 [Psilocybe cubensis]